MKFTALQWQVKSMTNDHTETSHVLCVLNNKGFVSAPILTFENNVVTTISGNKITLNPSEIGNDIDANYLWIEGSKNAKQIADITNDYMAS